MALYGAFDATLHLDELDTPLVHQEGVLTAAQRRSRVMANLFGGQAETLLGAMTFSGTVAMSDTLDVAGDLTVDGAVGTGAATAGVLTLTTPELTIVDADQLGRIDFQAPLETGADAILVAASIYAEADNTFAATNNETDLVFALGVSEVAAEKMRLHHGGDLTVLGSIQPESTISVVADTSSVGVLSFEGGMNIVTVTTDADDFVNLPTNVAADIGKTILVYFAGGCEVRSADASADLNNVIVGATNEAPFVTGDFAVFRCVADNQWQVHAEDIVGATKTILPNGV